LGLNAGGAEYLVGHTLSFSVAALGPVATRARVLVHEAYRAGELAERQRTHSADHAGLAVEKYRAGRVFFARGLVVKRVDQVELRVVVAAVLTAAADAVLVAHHPPKLLAHLFTALALLHVNNLARRTASRRFCSLLWGEY
jgi:hypothetical protein